MSYLVTSERMRRGHRKTLAMLLLLFCYLRWPGRGETSAWKKKPVTNEVSQALEISWSRYLILFSEKPFNFLLLKKSNLLFVAKLPKLIEGWLISLHFLLFELHCFVTLPVAPWKGWNVGPRRGWDETHGQSHLHHGPAIHVLAFQFQKHWFYCLALAALNFANRLGVLIKR